MQACNPSPWLHVQVPGLAVVIVGERKDSQTYVRMKRKVSANFPMPLVHVSSSPMPITIYYKMTCPAPQLSLPVFLSIGPH